MISQRLSKLFTCLTTRYYPLPLCTFHRKQLSTDIVDPVHICVVGSGPAGFYTTQQLLKGNKSIHVDIYERLPVPFGLVRYGVAPDHPEVKNVIHTFTQTASHSRCSYLGNIHVGDDISIDSLRQAYTAVVLCYGCDSDKKLNIPGEDVEGVLSAREFVGWYNGLPEQKHLNVDLSSDTAVILGHGNVAFDMARMILTPTSILSQTDITEYALKQLEQSRIRRVYIVGRRGPLQVAFTIKELREMTKIPDCRSHIDPTDFKGLYNNVGDLPRPRRRLTQLMFDTATASHEHTNVGENLSRNNSNKNSDNEWILKFLRSPTEILSHDGKVTGVRFVVNELQGERGKEKAVSTSKTEDIPCGLVLRSIGYQGVNIDKLLPFNDVNHTLQSSKGRVEGSSDVYCSGWIRRGAEGVLVTTMNDAFEVGRQIVSDLESGQLQPRNTAGKSQILGELKQKGVRVVTFDDWNKIDKAELHSGEQTGKPREKITDICDMLALLDT